MCVCDWHAYLKNILIKTRARIENVSGIPTVQNPLNEINLLKAEYMSRKGPETDVRLRGGFKIRCCLALSYF